MSLQWLIVGGGIHGVHIAARLLSEGGVEAQQLRIVDPAAQLLARWRACTATTGMTHLRSPSVHHLDTDAWSLQRFAGPPHERQHGLFAPPYDRPSLELFNAHCDEVIETFGLTDLHVQGRVEACEVHCDEVSVRLADGQTLTAQQVVLAIGAGEQPQWPDWALPHRSHIHHVFAHDFDGWPSEGEREAVAVVGGGISACQIALRLSQEGHQVSLIARHALRRHQFDSAPGWLGPKFMAGFGRERDLQRRRAMITEARYRGSVPPDVHDALLRATAQGHLVWHEAQIEDATSAPQGVRLRLSTDQHLLVQRVLLATGFEAQRPGGAMLDTLIAAASLPCAECGYPVVDHALRWHPRVYVSGPLAELELGPVSRNIAGARRASDRLITVLRDRARA